MTDPLADLRGPDGELGTNAEDAEKILDARAADQEIVDEDFELKERIVVRDNARDYPWAHTAFLQEWDGEGWRDQDAANGDTPEEAKQQLRGPA